MLAQDYVWMAASCIPLITCLERVNYGIFFAVSANIFACVGPRGGAARGRRPALKNKSRYLKDVTEKYKNSYSEKY